MLKVRELSAETFPKDFIETLPLTCETCGEDNEVSESLTFLQCSNRKCPSKVVYRLYCMLQDLGVKGMTLDKCASFLELFETNNPYTIFLYNPEADGVLYDGCSDMLAKKIYRQISLRRGMLLWEFIKVGNLPNLRESAEKIFGGYTDLGHFYADLATGGIPFLQKLLLAGSEYADAEGILVQAVTIYETLVYFKEDIEEGYKGVVIVDPEMRINVIFAEHINMDLINQLNITNRGKLYFNVQTLLTDTTDVVLIDNVNNIQTSKLKKLQECPNVLIVHTKDIGSRLSEIMDRKERLLNAR